MENIYWKGIHSFILVVKEGSFTSAAEASGRSKAILSQQVSELEKAINAQLLYRTTRHLRLTEIGRQYYSKALVAVQQLEQAQDDVIQSTNSLKGTIKLNMVGGILGEEVISPLLIAFQQKHPEVELKLSFSSIHEDLLASSYDLVFRLGKQPDSSLITRHLYTIPNRYVASPNLIDDISKIKQPEDLKAYPLIYGSVKEWLFEKDNTQQVITTTKGFQATNGLIMLKAAKAGLGICRMTELRSQQAINEGSLVEVLADWAQPSQLSIVCPPHRYQIKRVHLLMEWMVERFANRYNQMLHR